MRQEQRRNVRAGGLGKNCHLRVEPEPWCAVLRFFLMTAETTTLRAESLASGHGWSVLDVVCTAGPHNRPFEERHQTFSLSLVVDGTFQYRSRHGSVLLAPGAVLLGNVGDCFECGHEHGTGDRCLSVQFDPGYWEDLVAAVAGARTTRFDAPRVPPAPALLASVASLCTARAVGGSALEEAALEFAASVLRTAGGLRGVGRGASPRDERRITEAVRSIADKAHDLECADLSLGSLARKAGMTPYHFLRTFRSVVGMTPYQYILHTRMTRAAARLRSSGDSISDIAYEAGFNDLSTFNRRFRRLLGASPGRYRERAKGAASLPAAEERRAGSCGVARLRPRNP